MNKPSYIKLCSSLILFTLALIGVGCGSKGNKNKKDAAQVETTDGTAPEIEGNKNVLISKNAAPASDIDLQLGLKNSGQALHLLDATALKDVFSPIFGSMPRTAVAGNFFFAHPTEYFSPIEKQDLGTFSYVANEVTLQNFVLVTTPSLLYLRTLRGFLLDACGRLVSTEYERFPEQPQQNILIKSKIPSEAEISNFMSGVFGFELASESHRGAKEYEAIQETLRRGNETRKSYRSKHY